MQTVLHVQSIFLAVSRSTTAGHLARSVLELRQAETTTSPSLKSYKHSHLLAKQEELAKKTENFALRIIFFILRKVKSYDMGPTDLVPLRRKACCGFLSLLKINRPGRVSTREP
jgi:hypothetical protein